MKNTKHLVILGQRLEDKYDSSDAKDKGEYGGKGKFELPSSHKAAMQVTKGGSCCKNCKYVDAQNHACKNDYYIQWNGGDNKLPQFPLDEICSDWWEAK